MHGCLLPEELVTNIMLRLPVKCLIRFRCVSKRWMNIIKSPIFISMHLTRMKNSSSSDYYFHNSCGGVVVSTNDWFDRLGNFTYDYPDAPYDFVKLNVGPTLPYKPSYGDDITVKNTPYAIIGYCDGIFCLSWNHLNRYSNFYNGYNELGHTIIALCNPAIRELRILPLSNTDFPPYKRRSRVDIGFGFDPKTNDYLVVKILMLHGNLGEEEAPPAEECIVEVYSMISNSWRMVFHRGKNNLAIIEPTGFDAGIFTSPGVLHWTMGSGEYDIIASFHMDDDSLRKTNLPTKYSSFEERAGSRSRSHTISLLNDKLALICRYYIKEELNRIEIFLLNNYGLDDVSWSIASIVESFPIQFIPLGFWVKEYLLVFNWQHGIPVVYDTITEQSMDLHQFTGQKGFFYKESLVSIKRVCEESYSSVS